MVGRSRPSSSSMTKPPSIVYLVEDCFVCPQLQRISFSVLDQ